MFGVGIGVVVMLVIRLTVLMTVLMAVCMAMSPRRDSIRLASTSAFELAERAALSQSLDVMVVTFLGPSYILFKAQHLSSVLAEGAIHCGVSTEHLVHPLSECVHHHRVLA